jgi:hypothetical protein
MPVVATFEFEIVPAGVDEFDGPTSEELAAAPFESFVLEVPTMNGDDVAARRAWWSAFHMLGPRGVEPEEFEVFELVEGCRRGRQVSSGGFVPPADEPVVADPAAWRRVANEGRRHA